MSGQVKSRLSKAVVIVVAVMLTGSAVSQQVVPPTGNTAKYAIYGTVNDSSTQKPIPFVTVQVVGSTRTALTNELGQYRIMVDSLSTELKFSHVAYYSERLQVNLSSAGSSHDLFLRPSIIEIPGMRVYGRQYEPGEQIIVEAIRRKKEILAKLRQYSCDAYTKMLVRDSKKPDSTNLFLITETQVSCFWEAPDKYKEIITARKQSANLKAEENLVAVGQILNFNENRIGPGIVSPTAEDALKYYRYFLLDTIEVDSQRVFVLEIEAKNDVDMLFEGTIQIADSSYDVVAVDVGINKGMPQSFVRNPHYSQRCARFTDGIWMPVEIQFSLDVKFNVKIPGVPEELSMKHIASLHSYSFARQETRTLFDEFALEVDPTADKVDSSIWHTRQAIPLTSQELAGYRRIDSVKHAPKPLYKQLPQIVIGTALAASLQPDFFHFNRVEGAYAGLGGRLRGVVPNADMRLKSGYAFDGKFWQHAYGATYHIPGRARMEASLEWHDEVGHRPAVVLSKNVNSTVPALFSKEDPLDYYGEKGFSLGYSTKVGTRTRFGVTYADVSQHSLSVATDYSVFDTESGRAKWNPGIVDGKLRSLGTEVNFDSRPLYKSKSHIDTMGGITYTHIEAGAEYASPTFIRNDFDFRRYYVSLFTRQRLLGLGLFSLHLVWSGSDRALPPQRYGTISLNPWALFNSKGFQTLDTVNFTGSRVLSITAQQNFGRRLFGKSGLPLVKKIPFTVGIHGGVFWSDFTGHPYQPGDEKLATAHHAYSELGFSLGNLTPFLAPFNVRVGFTWQLSHYPTNKFALSWDIGM